MNDTRVKITIEPHVNKMLLPMIKSPLKLFVNGLIDKIEGFDFSLRLNTRFQDGFVQVQAL